jgi:hypothetical protein
VKLPNARRFLFLVSIAIGAFGAFVGAAFAGLWSARLLDQYWVDSEFARLCEGEPVEARQGIHPSLPAIPDSSRRIPGPVSAFDTAIEIYVSTGKPATYATLTSRKTGGLCYFDHPCSDPVVGGLFSRAPRTMTVIAHKTAVGASYGPLQWMPDWRDSKTCHVRLLDMSSSIPYLPTRPSQRGGSHGHNQGRRP